MKKRIWYVLFLLYSALMLWLLFDRSTAGNGSDYWEQLRSNLNLRPLRTIRNYLDVLLRREYYLEKWGFAGIYFYQARHAAINLVGNLVMFVPLGFLLPRTFPRLDRLWKTLAIVVLAVILVELVQLFTLLGSCDVDDLILNTLGAALGYGLQKWFFQ